MRFQFHSMMENSILFLGTGTSVGIPMIGCPCKVCNSNNIKDKRLRTSAYISYEGRRFLIDMGPDFRWQMLRNKITHIDAILLTHPHRDHLAGFDDIRAFNFLYEKSIDLYTNELTWDSVKKQFYYAFEKSDYKSMPTVKYHEIRADTFQFEGISIQPISVMHGKLPCLGYRLGNLAYITDANFISEEEMDKLKGLNVLVLDSLRKHHHPSHFTLEESLAIVEKLQPKKTYFIHMSHHMGLHEEVELELPQNVFLAYDGLQVGF